jgi:hypothetical protein
VKKHNPEIRLGKKLLPNDVKGRKLRVLRHNRVYPAAEDRLRVMDLGAI